MGNNASFIYLSALKTLQELDPENENLKKAEELRTDTEALIKKYPNMQRLIADTYPPLPKDLEDAMKDATESQDTEARKDVASKVVAYYNEDMRSRLYRIRIAMERYYALSAERRRRIEEAIGAEAVTIDEFEKMLNQRDDRIAMVVIIVMIVIFIIAGIISSVAYNKRRYRYHTDYRYW